MTLFRLKQLASTTAHATAGAIRWNYDRAELIADGVVHGIGIFCGLVAATVLIVLAATYNLWPVSRVKWVLRRFDHSAIYALIAATYTPFIVQMKHSIFAVAVWTA